MRLIHLLLLVSILFFFYVEYSIGNVFYRIDSSGTKVFHICNIFNYMIEPFRKPILWNYELLDVNYVFIMFITICFHKFFLLYYNK